MRYKPINWLGNINVCIVFYAKKYRQHKLYEVKRHKKTFTFWGSHPIWWHGEALENPMQEYCDSTFRWASEAMPASASFCWNLQRHVCYFVCQSVLTLQKLEFVNFQEWRLLQDMPDMQFNSWLLLTAVSWAVLKGFPYRLQGSSPAETDFIFKLLTSCVK